MKLYKIILIVVVVLILFLGFKKYKSYRVQKQTSNSFEQLQNQCNNTETIFVSIPSYRDPECAKTLVDMFNKASCPYRIFAGVCVQNEPLDPQPLDEYDRIIKKNKWKDFHNQMRVLQVPASEAKGPMFARHLIETKLYRGEVFYLMIDSHTRFIKNWDEECIMQWKRCSKETPNPILTYYPDDFNLQDQRGFSKGDEKESIPSYLRAKEWCKETGALKIEGAKFKTQPLRPIPSLFWAAGFSFSSGQLIKDCPIDRNYPFLFFGEEHLQAVRYFTHGYMFYTPCKGIIRHQWSRNGRLGTYWEQWLGDPAKIQMEKQSRIRLKAFLGIQGFLTPESSGMGKAKTMQQYQDYTGVYPYHQTFHLNSKLGVASGARNDELIAKFGSLLKYQKIMAAASLRK